MEIDAKSGRRGSSALPWLMGLVAAMAGPVAASAAVVESTEVFVPATASPWLAGMPDGIEGCSCDSQPDLAPGQSPVLVEHLTIGGGGIVVFEASGAACHCQSSACCAPTPDGLLSSLLCFECGSLHGIAGLCAPLNALVGVFLDDEPPDSGMAPAGLSFTTAASRDFLVLAPELRQVFFIGDGATSAGVTQQFVIPAGATRLFLGIMDGCGWRNNLSGISVVATRLTPPCPADLTNNGIVDGADLAVLLGFWGLDGKPVAADINGDGIVDDADLALMLGSWGNCP